MSLPEIVSREDWLEARKRLLVKEKEATRARDELNAERRRLPMVRIDKEYVFEGPDGKASLLDLFDGRLQLIVHHFMFDPSWDTACRSCSAQVDNICHLAHLHARATTLVAVSRAPYPKIAAFRERMGWAFPWFSSFGSDFNYDFHVTLDESVAPIMYNYRTKAEFEERGQGYYFEGGQSVELPGLSTFLRVDDTIYHTYSTFARGLELLGSTTSYLDLTALGRQEEWEQPAGRLTGFGAKAGSAELRYHDEY